MDCDQDAVWLKVRPQGDGGACHVGFRSCFYRVVEEGRLVERGLDGGLAGGFECLAIAAHGPIRVQDEVNA